MRYRPVSLRATRPREDLIWLADSEQPGGFFGVDDVDRFFQDHKDDITFTQEPIDNGPIRYAAFHDVSGHLIRVFHELAE